jgi:uncharacterized iron-regulated protein
MFLSLSAFGSPSLREAEVIYLPETHDNPEDHKFQEEFIKRLYQEGYRFVLAMEMFQQPFQKHLDDYIACKISEDGAFPPSITHPCGGLPRKRA